MSFSIGSLFGGNNQNTPAQPAPNANSPAANTNTPTQPGNLPATDPAANPAAEVPDINNPAPNVASVEPVTPDSPLDQFKGFWDTVPNEAGNNNTPAQLDPAKLQEVISKANFTQTITPETLQLITAGGEGAAAAFTDALNTVAQQVLMQSTMAANKMNEQAIAASVATQNASLPDLIRSQTTTNNLNKANPIFSDPAVKPVIEAVQMQLAAANPNATADQLTEMAQNYVAVMGEAFAPKPVVPAGQEQSQEINWDSFLNGN
jgi:hypothetical protein